VPFSKQNDQAIIEDTIGYLTCKVVESQKVGDHNVYFGEVINEEIHQDKKALNTMQLETQYTKEKAEIYLLISCNLSRIQVRLKIQYL